MSDSPTAPLPDSTPKSLPDGTPDPGAAETEQLFVTSDGASPTISSPSADGASPPSVAPGAAAPADAQPTAPLNTDAWASAPQASPVSPSAASAPRRNRPRFATILWGVLLLVFAGFMIAWTVLPTAPDPTLLLIGAVIAIGISLVAAGIAAASRRAG